MDKKEKFLNKIPVIDRERILEAIDKILIGDITFLDIKKLKGSDNQFRVRVGKYRIKFTKYPTFNQVMEVCKRGEGTY